MAFELLEELWLCNVSLHLPLQNFPLSGARAPLGHASLTLCPLTSTCLELQSNEDKVPLYGKDACNADFFTPVGI